MRNRLLLISLVMLCLVSAPIAFSALSNNNKSVDMVESLDSGGGRVFIHLGERINEPPGCSEFEKIIGCQLSDSFCEPAMRIALGAQMSGKKIEFEVKDRCVGNGTITEFSRLRIKPN